MLKRYLNIFCIIFTLFFLIHNLYSQKKFFRNYSLEDGLPQVTVLSLYQDHHGYLWIGTQAGLSRFNGRDFKNFDSHDSLGGNHVNSIFQDSRYRYWFGHRYEGVTMYKNNKFYHLPQNSNLGNNLITSIIEDSRQNIWVSSMDHGIFAIKTRNKHDFVVKNLSTDIGFPTNFIGSLIKYDNKIWAASDSGIIEIDYSKNLKSIDFHIKRFSKIKELNGTINCITRDSTGNIWVLTPKELIQLPPQNTALTYNSYSFPQNIKIVRYFENISVGKDGAIWGTHLEGVYKFDGENFEIFDHKNGLPDNEINTVIVDFEGNTWIGTSSFGIYQYTGDKFNFFDKETGLINNQVTTIHEDSQNNVWLGTEKGVSVYDGKKFTNYNKKDWLTANNISCIYQDSKENVWVASYTGAPLVRYTPSNRKPVIYKIKDGLPTHYILSINEDKNGKVWIASLGMGAAYYEYPGDGSKGKFHIVSKKDGICSNVIWQIHKDKKGNLWFGSDDAGVSVYDGKKFKTFNEKDGLSPKAAAITHDSKNNIWIATIGDGVYKYDQGTFYHFGLKDGLSSESPFSIICDNNDIPWVGTNTGVDKFDTIAKRFIHYGKEDGFIGIENNQNAVLKDHKGRLWFGTVNGVVLINPDEFKPNRILPRLVLEKIQLFYQDFNYELYTDSIDAKTSLPLNLRLPYNKNHLKFYFVGLSFTSPEKIKYKYKLEGFDKEWNPVTKNTDAVYTNIPPGDYKFMFKACNSHGYWNKEPYIYAFKVIPPFWQKTWFYVVVIIFGFLGIYLIHYLRTMNLKNTRDKLRKMVEVRTQEILSQKNEIVYQRDKLKSLNEELQQQQVQILEQNEELKQQKEEISSQRDEIESKNLILEKVNKLIEGKNKHITDSIKYAKRIQEAILPQEDYLANQTEDYFIINLPKDIVSGDFYWFNNRNNKLYIAVVDCTGHGVPGSFLSIIGNNMLNQALNEYQFIKPSDILNFLTHKLNRTLHQSYDDQVKAGMAITLCVIDKNNMKLQYASSQSSFYIVSNGQVYQYKGEKYPIGYIDEDFSSYETIELKLNKADHIYILTDGYTDQFGGKNNRKFMNKRFKFMLKDIETFNMEKQKEHLLAQYTKWKGDNEQVDDILVIGIKI